MTCGEDAYHVVSFRMNTSSVKWDYCMMSQVKQKLWSRWIECESVKGFIKIESYNTLKTTRMNIKVHVIANHEAVISREAANICVFV